MSFDLIVLAIGPPAGIDEIRAMAQQCSSGAHPDGELDHRIVGFYEELTAELSDTPPYDHQTPWANMPLGTGIDHVSMSIRFGPSGDPAIVLIIDLADKYGLVIFDPQDGTARLPAN